MVYVHFTVERFFFSYFNHLPAKRNVSANILGSKCPFWVANTIFLLLRKTYFSSRKKRSFRQNIDDIGYSPKLFFSFCLSHTFITHVLLTFLFFIIHFFLPCSCCGHGRVVLRQWGVLFCNIHLLTKRTPYCTEKKAETISKLLENWLKLIIV